MDTNAKRRIAFRIYGKFQWPPNTIKFDSTADETGTIRPGVVEIHYADTGTGGKYAPILRWVPKSGEVTETPFSDDLSKVPLLATITDAKLTTHIGDGTAPFAIRLDQSATLVKEGRRLVFRGAVLFDQFPIDSGNNSSAVPFARPELRLLLTRRYKQGANVYFSDLAVGQMKKTGTSSKDGFRFNLALPTALPQVGTGTEQVSAVLFGAVYSTAATVPSTGAVAASRLFAGPPTSTTEVTPTVTGPLGSFDFAKSNLTVGTRQFVYLRDQWLKDEVPLKNDVLGPIGFDSTLPNGYVRAATGTHPSYFSVRFGGAAPGGSRVIVRHALESVAKKPTDKWDKGDLGFFNNRLHLRMPELAGPWLDVGVDEAIVVEMDQRYKVEDNEIWSLISASPLIKAYELDLRIGLKDDFLILPESGDGTRNSPAQLLQNAAMAMRLAIVDLQNINSGGPDSLLPDIQFAIQSNGPNRPQAQFALFTELAPELQENGRLAFKFKQPLSKMPHRPAYRLSLWPDEKFFDTDGLVRLAATAKLPLFGEGFEFKFDLVADTSPRDDSHPFQFRIVPTGTTKRLDGRLGGLGFATPKGKHPLHPLGDSYLKFGFRQPVASQLGGPAAFFQLADIDLHLMFQLTGAQPLGPDVAWGSAGDYIRPLLIPLDDATAGQFILEATETIGPRDDRRLTATLLDPARSNQTGGDGYVLLSQQPFGVVRFRSPSLQNRGGQDDTNVASYDSSTRQWQLKRNDPNALYHYQFPPQSAGESMDKPRRLELLDVPYTVKVPQPPAERPYVDERQRRAVEFALTPSAELWIKPNDVERNFLLPEWATAQLFTQRSELGLGAALRGLRAEFLYGLAVGVDPALETGPARGARVAEIEALQGHPPAREPFDKPKDQLSANLAKRWEKVSSALASRPERLEFWAADPAADTPLAPVRFEKGARFALRETALHRPPVLDARPSKPGADGFRTDERGLSGGALWPVESANLFNALLETPQSTGGSIERIALSPNGGDADQTARFLNDRVSIISETRNGFVQRHKVEVIGRIGVFWNRAKHVVVYERTVNPSEQFTPKGGLGARTRRPVLRKVSEYIELIEPIRNYPDFAAPQSSSGFLRSTGFNHKTINVDSAWSEDVGTFGWKIPLWNRASASERPRVYPRPDIGFTTAAEGEGEQPLATQECLDPENLFFFADVSQGVGADTDRWVPRVGIDFSNLPAPSHVQQRPLGDTLAQRKQGEERLPSARRVPRGHRRFTWRLAPPQRKVMLNAGRGAEPIYAGLETITFMRSNLPDQASGQARAQEIDDALQEATRLGEPASTVPYWPNGGAPPPQLAAIGTALDTFIQKAASGTDTEVKNAALALATALPDVNTELATEISDITTFAAPLKKLGDITRDGQARCEKLIEDFVGSVRRKQLLVLEQIKNWEANLLEGLPPVGTVFNTEDELVDALARIAMAEVEPVLGEAVKKVRELEASVEAARQIAVDLEDDIERLLRASEAGIKALRASYDDAKPWSEQRLFEFHQRLANVQQGIIADIDTAISEAQNRLATELDQLAQRIAAEASHAIAEIGGAGSALTSQIDALRAAGAAHLATIADRIKDARTGEQFDKLKKAVEKAIEKDASNGSKYAALLTRVQNAVTTLADKAEAFEQECRKADIKLSDSAEGIAWAVKKGTAEGKQFVADSAQWVTAQLAEIQQIIEADLPEVKADLIANVEIVGALGTEVLQTVADLGLSVDAMITDVQKRITAAIPLARTETRPVFESIDEVAVELRTRLQALEDHLGPSAAEALIRDKVLAPAIRKLLVGFPIGTIDANALAELRKRLRYLSDAAAAEFVGLTNAGLDTAVEAAREACRAVGGALDDARAFFANTADAVKARVASLAGSLGISDVVKLRDLAKTMGSDIRAISNDLSGAYANANAYADRVSEAIGRFDKGDLAAAPSNVLKLYAAVASAPALPNLAFARERLGYYYGQLNEVIDTTPVEAWFGRLGDELKAMGLSLPFDKIGDRLLPDDLSQFDIGRILKNFGGLKLDKLFKGYKLPKGARDAIRVTHAFDKKQFRAWVQIDVNLPLAGRKSLFSIGPFQLDFLNSNLVGQVRLEASKDSDRIEQTGRAVLGTDIEAVVAGQPMVTMRKVAVRYEKSSGLKVDFDPKQIKLNAVFQFIQDTLGSLFPDEIGGMKLIKQNGIPVGVEHEFAMPPVSLMYATSGVSNIYISNHFSLVAFPDFVIADRFSLSKPEMPFLFSIFIIGGTGYITVDTSYRPFRDELMVVVEAAAGGSASLGFAFGPVTGQVWITLSVALSYRKLIGKSGGGLTVSLVLLIAGNVDVAGIVTIYIGLLLRMSYRDNGQIDATGTLTVTIRISRFFKIKVRANVQYKLRGGKSQTTSSVSTDTEITDDRLKKAADKAKQLMDARG